MNSLPLIKLVDANNHCRVMYETDPTGLAMNTIAMQAFYEQNPQLWIWDGFNSRQRRREVYKEYKGNRAPAPDDFWKVTNYIKELLKHTSAIQISVPGVEADDVIAHFTRTSPNKRFFIVSTDGDFFALHNENVSQSKLPPSNYNPKYMRLFKAIVHDKSDNVPGIHNFGSSAFEKISKDHWIEALEAGERTPYCLIGLSPGQHEWVMKDENWQKLLVYWKIVDFFPVTDEEINQNMIIGKPNYGEMKKLLEAALQPGEIQTIGLDAPVTMAGMVRGL